jgi:hypothetical protein
MKSKLTNSNPLIVIMEHGIVYYRNTRRGMFVVMMNADNFLVFESYEITAFHVGDILAGNFSTCGLVEIMNTTTLKSHSVVIQNIGCNESLAIDKADLP